MAEKPTTDTEIYATCMADLRDRLKCIESLVPEASHEGDGRFILELIFLEFRKCLELIALGSLTANRRRYAEAHQKFHEHWRAKDILKELEKIHPDFYPKPITLLSKTVMPSGGNRIRYDVVKGALTKPEFERLYDATSEILHVRNPFSKKPNVIDIGYAVPQWIAKIKMLVRQHALLVVDGQCWICGVPERGNVWLRTANPDDRVR